MKIYFKILNKNLKTNLDSEVASVDVVTEEEVAVGGRGPADLEQLHQVVELSVDITTD